MKTNVFYKKLTSAQLQENLEKQFGARVNLNRYSREQLEDHRNKLRTRIHQVENSAGYNDLLTNETYQKDKAMLELLNTRIKEMLGEDIKKLRDKIDQLSEAKKGVRDVKHTKKAKGTDQTGDGKRNFDDVQVARMTAGGVPKKTAIAKATSDKFTETAKGKCCCKDKGKDKCPVHGTVEEGMKDGDTKTSSTGGTITKTKTGVKHTSSHSDAPHVEPAQGKVSSRSKTSAEKAGDRAADKKTDKDSKDWQKRFGKDSVTKVSDGKKVAKKESIENFRKAVRSINESLTRLLQEDEEGKAKAITAAGDIVNDYTSWMQRVGQYQTKSMIELADAIRADFGAQQAETFKQAVGPALTATLETMTQQREAISNAVAVLAGEQPVEAPMGQEPEMGPPEEPGMDMSEPDQMNEPADEFGASDAASGAGSTGREMRESRFARKLAESHSIISKLAK